MKFFISINSENQSNRIKITNMQQGKKNRWFNQF